MFTLLTGCSNIKTLPAFICNPFGEKQKIFLLFDLVHIFKCLRNNLIKIINHKKAFTFRSFDNNETLMRASSANCKCIYMLKINCVLRKALRLSWKALHSYSLGRQNDKLALKIFSDTIIAALKCFGPGNKV